ncbi:MAG: hypothetical protein LBH43_04095 [Treponema sp.]|nr:hypothetical protein [Treponema sp.]
MYYILEQAELRGLCSPLSGVRPYTRNVVIGKINEILNSENTKRLGATEREILNNYLGTFSRPKTGINWQRGAFFSETAMGSKNIPLSMGIGVTADIEGSTGIYLQDGNQYGMELWLGLWLNGDLGHNLSYEFIFEGGLMRIPRNFLGKYNTYYEGFPYDDETDSAYAYRIIDVYSEPLTHFPYTYKKRWEYSIVHFSSLTYMDTWPQDLAASYNLPTELAASFLENKLTMRLGRISREWSSTAFGSSLAYNQMARPFLALEAEFNPVSWLGLASLTGFLEFYNRVGLKETAMTFQNAFSIGMLQLRYKNYLFFDIVDAVVWPKRLELGYIAPIINNYFYQNNAGDFDNMAVTLNLKAQYPGLGNLWFSFFVDEMDITVSDFSKLDREMIAVQAGMNLSLPFLSFSSLKISYTKINPYCYTHPRIFSPWYGDLRMETAYVNNGACLGYYLPPNSDELLVMYKTMPAKNVSAYLQYQLIRHGADFGPSAVDGSNLLSELYYPAIGSGQVELYRFFLRDGAYQWNHIIKVSAEWNLPGLPVSLFGEAGAVISYFTNIAEPANSKGEPSAYSRINTSDYPESTGFIVKIGLRVFGR